MDILDEVIEGIDLIRKTTSIFYEKKTNSQTFISPFLLFNTRKTKFKSVALSEFSDECINSNLSKESSFPKCFVLGGESELEDPKTKEKQYFFVIKLYLHGFEQGYIYSIPFIPSKSNKSNDVGQFRYVGSDNNVYLPIYKLEGESSSCNAIKMDPKPPYSYRAAFLIGHMDETRLWHDVKTVIADMYCKLAPDNDRLFELIFEVSKFGRMTSTMQADYDKFVEYFNNKFVPSFRNVKSSIELENTRIKGD